MDFQKENNLIQEAFNDEAHSRGFCLDQEWSDCENPYLDGDTNLAFDFFKSGWQAAIARMEVRINTLDEMLLNQGEALAQAKAQAVPDTNISFKDWISDHKNDYVHFGGYQERAHELANRAWNASANNSTPKDKVLMPKKLSTKHIDYVVKELAITGGISLIEEVYQCLIEAQELVND